MTTQICPRCQAPLPTGTPPAQCPRCLLRLGLDTGFPGSPPPSSERRPPPSPAELAGDFPQLEILEVLGQGGMGTVYKARQKSLDRLVALKILTVDAGADPGFAERFAREARTLAALDHPNIVRVYDSGRVGERFYFVMEYVDGTDLRRMLRAGRVAPREGLAIVVLVSDALQYAHDQGVVHRDIKPENILLDRRGRVKIADFGLAKLVGRAGDAFALTGTSQAMGTPHYMAPEQIEHPQDVDHRADIYSLGVVLYELLTGELPLGRFVPPSRKVEIDVRLDEVVLKALEKDPPRRYQHASEIRTSIDGLASGAPVAEQGGTEDLGHDVAHARSRFHKPLFWVAVGSVSIGCLITLLFLSQLSAGRGSPTMVLLVGPWFLLGAVAALLWFLPHRGHARATPRSPWPWVFGCFALLCVPLGLAAVGALLLGRYQSVQHAELRPLDDPLTREVPASAQDSQEPLHSPFCQEIDAARAIHARTARLTELTALARRPGLSAHEQLDLAEALLEGGFFAENADGLVALIEEQELAPATAERIRAQVAGESPSPDKTRVLDALAREPAPAQR